MPKPGFYLKRELCYRPGIRKGSKGRTRYLCGQFMSTHDEILNALGVEFGQQIAEVLVHHQCPRSRRDRPGLRSTQLPSVRLVLRVLAAARPAASRRGESRGW